MNILALIGKYWEIGVGPIMALLLWIVSLQRKTIKKKKAEVETLEKAVEVSVKGDKVKEEVIKTKDNMTENNNESEKAKEEITIKIKEAGDDKEKQQAIVDNITNSFNNKL
jgi:predicted Holliday junction resolvase-like endonuclease